MRRRFLTFLLVAITMAVPLWAAMRSERSLLADGQRTMQMNRATPAARLAAEAATLVVTGIILIGLASAVRRTS
jgi:hypothetical protein